MSVTRPCSLELVDELLQIGTRLGDKDRIGVDELEPAKNGRNFSLRSGVGAALARVMPSNCNACVKFSSVAAFAAPSSR